MKNPDLNKLNNEIERFVSARDWKQFHSLKNLTMALSVESSELLEIFQWMSEEESNQIKADPRALSKVEDEVADIFYYLLQIVKRTDIDLEQVVLNKLKKNSEKYPVELARGNSKKYDELQAVNYSVRLIEKKDNVGVARLIRTVMPEFGASGPGFAINDPEVSHMAEAYSHPRHIYFVVTDGSSILGGGGIAPLAGEEEKVCELRKMYFMPEIRGKGLGQTVMDLCLEKAREFGFQECYLETLKLMTKAQELYRRNGFEKLSAPKGATGHFSCDSWYSKKLV